MLLTLLIKGKEKSKTTLRTVRKLRRPSIFARPAFDMGKIKKEEARYQELPKIYAFKSARDKEIMLNRNFARVSSEIDQLIETVLGASKQSG